MKEFMKFIMNESRQNEKGGRERKGNQKTYNIYNALGKVGIEPDN